MPKPRIYFDANPIIDAIKYDITGSIEPERLRNVLFTKAVMEAARDGVVEIVSSSIIIVECRRADSKTRADEATRELINRVLTSGEIIKLASPTLEIVEKARDLDWVQEMSLRAADAIHVATAIQTKCDELFSTDGKIKTNAAKIAKLGVSVVAPSETKHLPNEYRAGKLFEGVGVKRNRSTDVTGKRKPKT